jgi:Fe-S-cluster-containing hydrogenase component 2
MVLRVAIERCTGCGNCELVCAFAHVRAGTPGEPRIHVLRDGSAEAPRATPIVCLQCDTAACVAVCPVGALARNGTTGAIDLDQERCIRCRSCLGACPFGNALWDDGQHAVAKCDLCGGAPWCARFCPSGALAALPIETALRPAARNA